MDVKRIAIAAALLPLVLVLLLVLLVVGGIRGMAADSGGDGLSVSCGVPARPMTADGRGFDNRYDVYIAVAEGASALVVVGALPWLPRRYNRYRAERRPEE